MVQKTALITGCGQDFGFLAQILLDKNYKVYCMVRRSAHRDWSFVDQMGLGNVIFVEGDLSDAASINSIVNSIKPDELYNLGAMSHVGVSFNQPLYCADVTGLGVLRLLEAVRQFSPKTKFYQAGSSEEFGGITESQNENTSLVPKSPYAAAKVFAHHICDIYRDAYGLFVVVGMLMNHESERRGKEFVTRKITDWIGKYVNNPNTTDSLKLGNLHASRDWGHSRDFCEAMYLMLQQESPKSYLIGTGETHTPKEFLEEALRCAGINFTFVELDNGHFKYTDTANNRVIVETCPNLFRPLEVKNLKGDPSLAQRELNWSPKITFKELVKIMVLSDINYYRNNKK
jgi:GDPmannose 4,6-dehydratase